MAKQSLAKNIRKREATEYKVNAVANSVVAIGHKRLQNAD
jgi:hypothetical protein